MPNHLTLVDTFPDGFIGLFICRQQPGDLIYEAMNPVPSAGCMKCSDGLLKTVQQDAWNCAGILRSITWNC